MPTEEPSMCNRPVEPVSHLLIGNEQITTISLFSGGKSEKGEHMFTPFLRGMLLLARWLLPILALALIALALLSPVLPTHAAAAHALQLHSSLSPAHHNVPKPTMYWWP